MGIVSSTERQYRDENKEIKPAVPIPVGDMNQSIYDTNADGIVDDSDGLEASPKSAFILHSLATAVSDFLVASGAGAFVKKTLAETRAILGLATTSDNRIIRADSTAGAVQGSTLTLDDGGNISTANSTGITAGDLLEFISTNNLSITSISGSINLHASTDIQLISDSGVIDAQSDVQIASDTSGGDTGTLGNAPHAGDPDGYLVFKFHGNAVGVPYWTL